MRRQPGAERAGAPGGAVTAASAEASEGLHYSSDAKPGITRHRAGAGFYYTMPDGTRVEDAARLDRIRKLAIPPACRDVWICRDPNGHLQATGIDVRGRKQYRYHPQWRCVRDAHKFERTIALGRALPRLRRRIARELKLPATPREKVLATIVRLLESTLIRVGNLEYARTNGSYGLATLRSRHVKPKGDRVRFRFRGKHGIQHEIEVQDLRLPRSCANVSNCPGRSFSSTLMTNALCVTWDRSM